MKKLFKNITISLLVVASLPMVNGCNSFLDVVPDDGLASIETAFNLRSTAIRYLATCYSYMTKDGQAGYDSGEDEFGRTDMRSRLDEAPYYAVPVIPGVHHTRGGLSIDLDGRVLDTNGDAIPGLYAAGKFNRAAAAFTAPHDRLRSAVDHTRRVRRGVRNDDFQRLLLTADALYALPQIVCGSGFKLKLHCRSLLVTCYGIYMRQGTRL